ncbi:MAG: hypothetical protein IPM18_16115 [Phycisphaerales bacterium]|nr:hypothetical protein [Phycisphaerales bacterium]
MSGSTICGALAVAGLVFSFTAGYVAAVDRWYEMELLRLAQPSATRPAGVSSSPQLRVPAIVMRPILEGLPSERGAHWFTQPLGWQPAWESTAASSDEPKSAGAALLI